MVSRTSKLNPKHSAKVWVERAEQANSNSPFSNCRTCDGHAFSDYFLKRIRLNGLMRWKHRFASMFGFVVHFKGETTTPPFSYSSRGRFTRGNLLHPARRGIV